MGTRKLMEGNPVMDQHPIQGGGGVVIFLVTLCWVSCDGLASHPGGGVVIFLLASCYRDWGACGSLSYLWSVADFNLRLNLTGLTLSTILDFKK